MRILPVLDLRNGQVVRGRGGYRQEYRPVVSRLTPSSHPVEVAQALQTQLGLHELYIADLDAIASGQMALSLYNHLRSQGFRLWVDAGIRYTEMIPYLAQTGIEGIVLGLETLNGPETLAEACHTWGERIIFSLDLRQGRPWGNLSSWKDPHAWSIAEEALARGVRRLLILDLAQVGSNAGTGTEELCQRITAKYPEIELAAGGGVRHSEDLRRLQQCGVQVVLTASALHDGVLRREHLLEFGAL